MVQKRSGQDIDLIERSISASVLMGYYEKYAPRYSGDYPRIRNREKLLDRLYDLLRKIGDGEIHDETIIYIAETKTALKDPRKARYAISISKKKNRRIFAIRMFYTKTGEMESLSTIEKNQIIWSPDNMRNTKHPSRTQYYLGFIYMFAPSSR